MKDASQSDSRRKFLKQCLIGGGGLALGGYALQRGRPLIDFAPGARGENSAHAGFDQNWKWLKEADWYEGSGLTEDSRVFCRLCPHECALDEGERGKCRVRAAHGGKLYTMVYGNPCAVHLDPVEKKPMNHFLPGTSILSVATAGCNLRCLYCQNWEISQSQPEDTDNSDLPPARLVEDAVQRKIPSIAYTYSEPMIFYEYAYDASKLARERRVRNVLVTAGYIKPDPLRKLCKVTDAANVDIKAFTEDFYKKVCTATLQPVLEGIKIMRAEGVWVEITNLVVPTLNDRIEQIKPLCEWILKELGPDTPLHFSRFYPLYKLKALPPTPADILRRARETAMNLGLHYVYVGNVPGADFQNTVCPGCKRTVISRDGYDITSNLLKGGRCPCGQAIAGVWA